MPWPISPLKGFATGQPEGRGQLALWNQLRRNSLLRRRACGRSGLHIVHRRLRPAIGLPAQRHDGQGRSSISTKVTLKVRREPVLSLRVQSSRMARTDQGAVGRREEQTAAAVQHIHAGCVQVWPSDGLASSDANVVSARRPLTTATPVYKQIIIILMPAQIRCFDGLIVGEGGSCIGRCWKGRGW